MTDPTGPSASESNSPEEADTPTTAPPPEFARWIGRTFPWGRVVRSALSIYLAIALFAALAADRIIFQPPRPDLRSRRDDILIAVPGEPPICAHFDECPGARRVLLYSHGNAEDLDGIREHLRDLTAAGAHVLAYDYPGYGRSRGTPSECSADRAAEAAYEYLRDERGFSPEDIVLYGRSVGGGPTLHLAARRPVAAVILEAPFTSAFRVLTRWPLLPFDRFPNISNIREVHRPVLILHGERDGVIPCHHGQQLFDALPDPRKRLVLIPGAGHNDLHVVAAEEILAEVRRFLAGIDGPP